jgi:hypothetical protein
MDLQTTALRPRHNDRVKCQRCIRGEEARWRVFTAAMEMKVCAACAEEARRLGIEVAALEPQRIAEPERQGSIKRAG